MTAQDPAQQFLSLQDESALQVSPPGWEMQSISLSAIACERWTQRGTDLQVVRDISTDHIDLIVVQGQANRHTVTQARQQRMGKHGAPDMRQDGRKNGSTHCSHHQVYQKTLRRLSHELQCHCDGGMPHRSACMTVLSAHGTA